MNCRRRENELWVNWLCKRSLLICSGDGIWGAVERLLDEKIEAERYEK